MHTCYELIRTGTDSLVESSSSARLDAIVLLSKVSGLSRTRLLADPHTPLPAAICEQFFELLAQRRQGVPVAYLVGEREFYSLPFAISSAVLIPRPETEQLVDLALSLLADRPDPVILDLGTGSGCIAIALALELRRRRMKASILAVDRCPEALHIAQKNAELLQADNVRFAQSDWFSAVSGMFDLIVSNPPYIPVGDPQVSSDTHFEPRHALYSGPDGCDAYRTIFSRLRSYLSPGGVFLGEHGIEQGATLRTLAGQSGFAPDATRTHPDLSGRDRFITCRL